MRIAICDDEKVFRKALTDKLMNYSKLKNVDFLINEYSDGKELLSSSLSFDIIFMDYQMNEYNGIDTVAALRKRNDNVTVIFISSFSEKVFDSFKVNTFRFLTKPVSGDELEEALSSCIKVLETQSYIILNDCHTDQKHRINQKDIIYCEADDYYSKVRTEKGLYKFCGTLSEFENKLSLKCFYRTHRSYIVNFNYISKYTTSEIVLINGEKALLTKRKHNEFQKAYINFLKSSRR